MCICICIYIYIYIYTYTHISWRLTTSAKDFRSEQVDESTRAKLPSLTSLLLPCYNNNNDNNNKDNNKNNNTDNDDNNIKLS